MWSKGDLDISSSFSISITILPIIIIINRKKIEKQNNFKEVRKLKIKWEKKWQQINDQNKIRLHNYI